MKKCFTTVLSFLFGMLILASCTQISDPVEEISHLVDDQIVLETEGSDGDNGGPKGGS